MLSEFRIGEEVRLLKIDKEFCSGLEPEDVEALKLLVGKTWKVEQIVSEAGLVEIRHDYPKYSSSDTPRRWISVAPEWIEKE